MFELPEPYRFVRNAASKPGWWPSSPDDPRRALAWAVGSPQEGVGFAGEDGGPAVWLRLLSADSAVPRMNVVDVCSGVRRGVPQDEDVLAAARAMCGRQAAVAANGYVSPLLGKGNSAPLLDAIATAARADGAVPAVLHCPAGDPLLDVVPDLGFEVGVTDLYASISLAGNDVEDFLATLPSRRRTRIRREMRALDGARVLSGADAEPWLDTAADLVAAAYEARGQSIEAASVAAIYRRLLAGFGDEFSLAVVEAEGTPVATTCLLAAGRTLMSYSAGFRLPQSKAVAGYFNATYYLPLRHAYATGRRRLLLGPGTIEAKHLRGARFTPLYSAVPRDCPPLVALLRRTDRWLRDRLAELA
ncbi:GNAT family N-acetyltransferase [Amycolatopsis sacchari]|uniref:GNAT family N-acetyltransferase n=1 Tax=Amycolatopsis sacchari TaxID=115433 RepID=UPI003D70D119